MQKCKQILNGRLLKNCLIAVDVHINICCLKALNSNLQQHGGTNFKLRKKRGVTFFESKK
jgi:hypothetical protein